MKSTWQYFIPKHLLSRAAGYLANTEVSPLKNFLIDQFVRHYHVNMQESLIENPHDFNNFNDFFTRELKSGMRTIDADPTHCISPADGCLSEWGAIQHSQLFQAKGQAYSLNALLANREDWVNLFQDGQFLTVYLAPKDYHRVHMPLKGNLREMIHVPGDLFSVNQKTTRDIEGIFARNERVLCLFDTACGPVAMILVGAMIVASIATVWHGQVTPHPRQVQQWQYTNTTPITLEKGAEMGRFYLGSTVILLFPPKTLNFHPELSLNQPLKLGQVVGSL